MTVTGRELRSTVTDDGTLRLTLEDVALEPPSADEVIVKVEAAPINPSDIGLLLGPANVSTLRASGTAERPAVGFEVPRERMATVRARLGQSLAVGNEGAGTVIASGENAKSLQNRRVGMLGGGMYADYRKLRRATSFPCPRVRAPPTARLCLSIR